MDDTWTNRQVVDLLVYIADLLEIKGEMPFKVLAYRRAAQTIEALDVPATEVWAEGNLIQLPAIGSAISRKLDELFRTGQMTFQRRLESEVPPALTDLLRIPGVAHRTVRRVWQELGVVDVDGLEAAAFNGQLRSLPRMGERSVARIQEGIRVYRDDRRRGR